MTTKKRFPLALGVLATLGLLFAGLALDASRAPGGHLRSGPVRIAKGVERPKHAYVQGASLFSPGKAKKDLAARVQAPLVGPLAPVAVPSPDGQIVAYNSWAETRPLDPGLSLSKQGVQPGEPVGTPSVRLYDEATGRDSLVERGSYSPAWRSDGALAYARALSPAFRPGEPYQTEVVVRGATGKHEVTWTTTPARYVVYGWAGEHLVVYRLGDDEQVETLVLDGPGRVRSLGAGSIIAVSPAGNEVLALGPDNATVRLLRIADGAELASLDREAAAASYDWLAYSGSWVGDTVVASGSPGFVVFRVAGNGISVDQVLKLDPAVVPAGVQEPTFDDARGDTVTATAEVPPTAGQPAQAMFVDCDRTTLACVRGEPVPARDWLRLVRDPSRPNGGLR